MNLDEVLQSAVPFRVPLRVPFRGVTHREGIILRGPRGSGEFAPFDDYDPRGASRWLAAAVDAAWGEPLPVLRDEVLVNAIIPDASVETTRELARSAAQDGCSTLKVKVGGSSRATSDDAWEHDIARVAAVRAVLDDSFGVGHGAIRLDANASWSVSSAVSNMQRLESAAGVIEYVEQPCASLSECAEFKALTGVKVAIDEGVRLAPKLDNAAIDAIREAADVVIVKPIPLGGAAETLRICELIGLPVVVSGSMDTSIGLSYVLQTACALPNITLACGLGTGALLAGDLTAPTLMPEAGHLRRQHLSLDDELLRRYQLPTGDSRISWWRERVLAAAQHLPDLGSVAS